MIKVNLDEAEAQLARLVEEAGAGQEVIITGADGSEVRLVAMPAAPTEMERPEPAEPARVVGHALDRFIGTWSAEQEAELLEAVEVFERVDDSFWR